MVMAADITAGTAFLVVFVVLAIVGVVVAIRFRQPTHRELRDMEDRLTARLRAIEEKLGIDPDGR